MHDPFSGRSTCLRGARLPSPGEQAALLHDHERRLAALARLRAAAAECRVAEDSDRDLVLLPEDELSLLVSAGDAWSELAAALRRFRTELPLLSLATFGFRDAADEPLAEGSPRLAHIGGGVEAWAFADGDGSIYKFFLPRDALWIGATFDLHADEEGRLFARSSLGSYRDLFEKLLLINASGGMPTEIVGVTPEGIVVAKQALGDRLPEQTDTTLLHPPAFASWPARFLRCDRDHPHLFFVGDRPWLVADTHERNFVRDETGHPRIIDLVAAPLPAHLFSGDPLLADWIERAHHDPQAPLLSEPSDDEL